MMTMFVCVAGRLKWESVLTLYLNKHASELQTYTGRGNQTNAGQMVERHVANVDKLCQSTLVLW